MPVALGVGLLAVLAAMFVLSLSATWDVTFGPMLRGIAAAIAAAPITSVGRRILHVEAIAAAIVAFEQKLRRAIGEAVGFMGAPLAHAMYAVGRAFVYPAAQVAELADDIATTLWGLRTKIVPAMIAAKVGWIPRHLAALAAQVASLVARAPVHIVHDVTKIVTKATQTVVNKAVAVPWPRIRAVEREAGAATKRIDQLARRTAPAAFAAAAVAAIARLGFSWVRCSKVGRAGRQVCGMDESLLESLIADTLLVVGAISIVEFAKALQAVEGEAVAGLKGFVREL